MMKNLRLFLLSALLLGAGTAAFAQNARCLPARTDGVDPYKAGEKIVFNVSYNWHAVQTDVAKANLTADQTTLNGEKVWHTALTMKTAPFFDVFFKIRESFESWFGMKGVEPRRFLRETREGDYHCINDYRYDHPAKTIHAHLEYWDKEKVDMDISFGDCTYDVTSLFYYARRMDFENIKPGTVYRISFAIDREVQTVNLTFLRHRPGSADGEPDLPRPGEQVYQGRRHHRHPEIRALAQEGRGVRGERGCDPVVLGR